MLSALQFSHIISKYLDTELALNRVVTLVDLDALSIQFSPFGVIPNFQRENEWRLILDLSSPADHSVNDGIDATLSSLQYSSVDHAVVMVRTIGCGALLAKLDIKSAYCNIPVHPDDRWLLGMKWQGSAYVDTVLPFGLRSAPKIFSAVADALLWIMHQNGVSYALHYLDDFLFAGEALSSVCEDNLERGLSTCCILGVPVAPDKVQGRSSVITFLGIEIDTISLQLRLPESKVSELLQTLTEWVSKRFCTKRQLLSLIGRLHHAASVVKPGRTFLRRLIDLSCSVSKLHHHIRLSKSARSDILWWSVFISSWNGISYMLPATPEIYLLADTSGSWGCVAIWNSHWFQIQWPDQWSAANIAIKEMLPIVVAAAVWGSQWTNQFVLCRCDNTAVVAVINSGWCRDQQLMQLMHTSFFYAPYFHFSFSARHIPGAYNTSADALSCNNVTLFHSLNPQVSTIPTKCPPELLQITTLNSPDWTLHSWREAFSRHPDKLAAVSHSLAQPYK